MLTKAEIKKQLTQAFIPDLQPESPYPTDFLDAQPRPAAVLIPFLEMENGWHVLFIRRTVISHDRHSGQVAFPGGRCDPSDLDAENAAIRETQEEVGINPSDIHILGQLRDMLTIYKLSRNPDCGCDFLAI